MALCGEIIDHNPLGGNDIAAKEVRYAATIARYQELFGRVAPENQWPSGFVAVPEIDVRQLFIETIYGKTITLKVKLSDTVLNV